MHADIILLAQLHLRAENSGRNDEVTVLELHFNVSSIVGPRWNKSCVEFDLGSSRLKFVDSIKYFGV